MITSTRQLSDNINTSSTWRYLEDMETIEEIKSNVTINFIDERIRQLEKGHA